MPLRRLAPLVVTAFASLAGSAQAASVSVYVPPCDGSQSKYGQCYPDEAHFVADPGEANRVTVSPKPRSPTETYPSAFHVLFKDDGAPVRAGAGCTQVDEHTADCAGSDLHPYVTTGDGNDTVDTTLTTTVDAGDGTDVVHTSGIVNGGPGDDTITGGDGADSLLGGTGTDNISGGGGNDTIQPDEDDVGSHDTVDGGEGVDILSYAGRTAAVTISLQDPGAADDAFSGFEGIRGGSGADRLTGDGGANSLEGGKGNDTLVGGDGDDRLDGAEGANVLDGGAGGDTLTTGGGRNTVTCGDGADSVGVAGTTTTLGPSCEQVGPTMYYGGFDQLTLHLPAASQTSSIVTANHLFCLDPCRIDLRVVVAATKHRGAILGQRLGRYGGKRKTPKSLGLRLSTSGFKLLKRMHGTSARITFATKEAGVRSKLSFLVRLDPPA